MARARREMSHLCGRSARRRRPSGLTLVEVLVALVILSLALLAYLNLILAASRSTAKGDYYSTAGRAAGDKIVQYQNTAFSSLTDGTTNYSVSGLPQGQMTVVIGPMGGNANIKQVDVTVAWTATVASQMSGQVRMSTLLSNTR